MGKRDLELRYLKPDILEITQFSSCREKTDTTMSPYFPSFIFIMHINGGGRKILNRDVFTVFVKRCFFEGGTINNFGFKREWKIALPVITYLRKLSICKDNDPSRGFTPGLLVCSGKYPEGDVPLSSLWAVDWGKR